MVYGVQYVSGDYSHYYEFQSRDHYDQWNNGVMTIKSHSAQSNSGAYADDEPGYIQRAREFLQLVKSFIDMWGFAFCPGDIIAATWETEDYLSIGREHSLFSLAHIRGGH